MSEFYEGASQPSLEMRADDVRHHAEQLAADPDSMRILHDRVIETSNGLRLSFRASLDSLTTYEDGGDLGNLQYLYISRLSSPNPVDHSVDISTLVTWSRLDGWLEGDSLLGEALAGLPADSPESVLLGNIITAVGNLENDLEIADDLHHAIALGFGTISSQGDEVVQRYVSRPLPDGSMLKVDTTTITGDEQRMQTFLGVDPVIKVSVQPADSDYQTSLDFNWDDTYETYVELADEIERDAYYARPEDVERDDDGVIVFVTNSLDEVRAIIAAERAIGSRQLRPELLSVIETALSAL